MTKYIGLLLVLFFSFNSYAFLTTTKWGIACADSAEGQNKAIFNFNEALESRTDVITDRLEIARKTHTYVNGEDIVWMSAPIIIEIKKHIPVSTEDTYLYKACATVEYKLK